MLKLAIYVLGPGMETEALGVAERACLGSTQHSQLREIFLMRSVDIADLLLEAYNLRLQLTNAITQRLTFRLKPFIQLGLSSLTALFLPLTHAITPE